MNRLAVCVGTIEFATGDPSVREGAVNHKGNARTAVTAVVHKLGFLDSANALKKFIDIILGQVVVKILHTDLVPGLFVGIRAAVGRALGAVAAVAGGAAGVVVFEAIVNPVSVEVPGIISLTRLLSKRGVSD